MPIAVVPPLWLCPDFENVPEALKTLPWAVWRAVPREKPDKYSKPPSNPITGRKIGADKPELWGTFKDARAAYEAGGWTGVGVLLTAGCGLVGVDIDDAKTTLKTIPEIKTTCEAYIHAGGYMEKSPSGTGLRGFVLGTLPYGRRKSGKLEIYDNARFLTVTGRGHGQIIADQEFINRYHEQLDPQAVEPLHPLPAYMPASADIAVVDRLTVTLKAAEPELWAGYWQDSGRYPSQSEADQALANKIARQARATGVPSNAMHSTVEAVFSRSGLGTRDKWTDREDYRQRTVAHAVGPVEANASSVQTSALTDFGARYFVAPLGGQTLIFDRKAENVVGDAMSPAAFHNLHANKMLDGRPISKKWFSSKARETLDCVLFDPEGRERPSEFNIWRGLPLSPFPGRCRQILRHIKYVWCSGGKEQYRYVLMWLAQLVQKPWRKPEVAIVLRSVEGTGKTIITNVLLDIFGRHGFTAAQTSQVAGTFNGHLMDKILVVLEEAMFAGDLKADSAAKVLITNPQMSYEWKGKDVILGRSYHHVLILSNRSWAVPAGPDARRYAVLDVSPHRKSDYTYFRALAAEIDAGGCAAFLHFLLKVNVSDFNPRHLPNTQGLLQQRVETLMRTDSVRGWWLSVLADGAFPVDDGEIAWGPSISSSDIQDSYKFSAGVGRYVPTWPAAIKQIKKLLPIGALAKTRPRGKTGGRHYEYTLPCLADARAEFMAVTGIDPTA